MKKSAFIILLLSLVVGCRNPGIVQLSPNTYMLSREDHAGIFGSKSALKAGVIRDANAFAAKQGKIAVPISTKEHPVGILGDWASFEYQFRVFDKDDPAAANQQQTAPQSSQAFKRPSVARRVAPSGLYVGIGDGHWIQEVLSVGKLIRLEDDSLWRVSPLDEITSVLWLPISDITVIDGGDAVYPYKLVNIDDNEIVNAKLLSE